MNEPTMNSITPAELARVSRSIYVDGPLLMRKLQHWRPYICPFELLLPYVPHGASVLDIGCGGGLFLGLLAGSGREVSGRGFDVSSQAIEVAKRMAKRLAEREGRCRLTFERLDVARDWPAGHFDVVSIIDVMHHVPPPAQRQVLLQAAEHVAPGGALIYKDMCRRPRWRALANRLHDLALARQWIHYLPIEHAEKWLSEAGMQVIHREAANRLWYRHEIRIFRKPA